MGGRAGWLAGRLSCTPVHANCFTQAACRLCACPGRCARLNRLCLTAFVLNPPVLSCLSLPALQAVFTLGPVVILFDASQAFYAYSSGIFPATACSTTGSYNHAMTIVGYNASAGVGSPDSYWIIRNSWGSWGEAGYARVQMTTSTFGPCSMYM